MEMKIKKFEELTNLELYRILKARAEVFVVEQDCCYQDLDDKDLKATHIWLEEKDKVLAYARTLEPGVSYEEASIGRVITTERGKGYGLQVMQAAVSQLLSDGYNEIRISAQCYAREFYEKCGFIVDSEEYLEDGIPHHEMVWKLDHQVQVEENA